METPQLSGHILIVDDEEFILDAFRALFEKTGCLVTCMESGKEALEVFKKDPANFDLLILDQRMPGMTGIELAKEVLAISPKTPIILMSGYTEVVNEKVALEAGVREFMMKPPDVKALCRIIKKIMPE
jgi:YesN/AraC family two-component response regulator